MNAEEHGSRIRGLRVLALAFVLVPALWAQLTTGVVEGRLGGPQTVVIEGGLGFRLAVPTDAHGAFAVALPYGRYRLSAGGQSVDLTVHSLRTTVVVADTSGRLRVEEPPPPPPGAVTAPLNFTGLADNRLLVESRGAASWTGTIFDLEGLDIADSYQPGRPERVVRDRFATEPGAQWHAAVSSAGTASFLASSNLPPADRRGLVQQPDRFNWLTANRAEATGPLAKWADFFASAAGQWSSQTAPLAAPGAGQRSRLLYGTANSRLRLGSRDRFDILYSGSGVHLSDWGVPAGIEALAAMRMAPQFQLPGGFAGLSETDYFDAAQVGWTHQFSPRLGVLQARYGYSRAELDTTGSGEQSRVELAGSAVTGAPPLANFATRARHQLEAVWQPALRRHRIVVGGGWRTSLSRNRFIAPSGMELITADGVPAFVMEFNTPTDTRARVRSFSVYAGDRFTLLRSLTLEGGFLADFSRGGPVAWNSVAPRAGLSWDFRRVTFEAGYSRVYAPLAGRYLDFGNPASLGGSEYRWIEPGERGALVARFGGPYSSIDPSLARPYADEFSVGAAVRVLRRTSASVRLFRRDYKRRLAAVNTGVPASAFTPVSILDPGPDGIPGTFDDHQLTVFEQNPLTFGQDHYLLTNPPGLRTLNAGMSAEVATQWKRLAVEVFFAAEKSYGASNPGDAFFENDPGVVGSLYADPNTLINATGRGYMDRAYVGEVRASYRLPWGVEATSVADYLDGLPFARQLLVTGLAQGPIVVAATVRGSPEGGHRTQYFINWNLRLRRAFELPAGRMAAAVDILNVTNAGQRAQESDLTGPAFTQRLPVSIQPPRYLRLELTYEF
jgi:hypothetical protein